MSLSMSLNRAAVVVHDATEVMMIIDLISIVVVLEKLADHLRRLGSPHTLGRHSDRLRVLASSISSCLLPVELKLE